MLGLETLEDASEIAELKQLIVKHQQFTNSKKAQKILDNWEENISKFVKAMPHAYKRVLEALKESITLSAGIIFRKHKLLLFYAWSSII